MISVFKYKVEIMHEIFVYDILRNLNFINEQFIHYA